MPYSNPAPNPLLGGNNIQGPRNGNQFLQDAQAAAAAAAAAAQPAPGTTPPVGGTTTGAGAPPAPGAFPNSNPVMENPSLSQYGFLNPNGWQNWQSFGGSNPNQWQNLGGASPVDLSGFGYLQQGAYTNGNVDPTQVDPTSASSLFGSIQPYQDAAYSAATRELDPQVQQQNAAFEQQMVNQGIAPGSQAYEKAKQSMSMQQNDAYAQARNQALQAGLGAQAQGFGQGLSQSQLSNQLAQALLGAQTSTGNQILGGNQAMGLGQMAGNNSLFNQLIGGNTSLASAMLGANASMYGSNAASSASHYGADLSHDIGQQTIDNNMLWNLINGGSGLQQYNNGLQQQEYNNSSNYLHGGQLPGGGTGNIDVQNPYNNQYNGQMNNWNVQNQNANQQNQAYMQLIASMFACARELKTTIGPLSPKKALQAVVNMPVDRWQYKEGGAIHVGTYAEEFHKELDLPDAKQIAAIDMLGAMLGAIKELAGEVRDIKNRLSVAGVN